ncbi:MAG: hypothetical protein ACYDB1_00845 [Acidiferrobacteraceae bacterium]
MLNLETRLTLDSETIRSPNLCNRFSEDDLNRIGEWVYDGYMRDKYSRSKWERRTEAAMDLAMQIQKAKSFPWMNCSNISFPLITISTLQYHAKAYPAIMQGNQLVRYRVMGGDEQGLESGRAQRISTHMSWQLLEEDRTWEEQHDRLLINYAVVGTAFKKSYFSHLNRHPRSDLVMAKDLVLDYWAKSIDNCPRKTHTIPMFRNEIYERIMRGTFRDVRGEAWYQVPGAPNATLQREQANNRQGITNPENPDETTAFMTLEQHVDLDLDGDGYAEPWIITVDEASKCVLRIVSRVDNEKAQIERTPAGEIISIRPTEYFTKYGFLPSADGGIYDTGFGVLMGPLNESVNSAINQIFDAGTMATAGGGFLGRGVKVRGGVVYIAPGQWQRIDSSGEDLKNNIVPYPVRDPSTVLYQLLVLLINYSNRIAGSIDVTVGENPGQNTPAETSRNMLEMGMKIYNAIFKRTWRSMKEEFRKIYLLNAEFLPDRRTFGPNQFVLREDYLSDPEGIAPVADPNISSEAMDLQRALTLKQAAMTTPGYSLPEVEHRFLKALRVEGIDQVYPGPDKVPPLQNPKIMAEQVKLQGIKMKLDADHMQYVAGLQEERKLNMAKIVLLQAQAEALIAKIGSEHAGQQIAAFDAAIGALKAHDDSLRGHIELAMKGMENAQQANGNGTGVPGMAPAPSDGSTAGPAEAMAGGSPANTGGGTFH